MTIRALIIAAALLAGSASAQQTPDLFYYRFNEGSGSVTANEAVPGVGTTPAPVVIHTLAPPPAGQFGDGALSGGGGTSYVNTNWPVGFGTGGWTISFWLDMTTSTSTGVNYLFGDPTALAFRCFTNGAAGAGNVILRGGPLTDVIITGGASPSAPHVCTYAYDPTGPVIRAYLDGVLQTSVAQGALNLTSAAIFRVAGQLSGIAAGIRMDEFRVYGRALTTSEVAATWNVSVAGPAAALSVVGPGCAGTGGLIPALSSTQIPTLGNGSFSLDLTQAAPSSSAFLFLSVGISPGYAVSPTCVTYLEPVSLIAFINVGFVPFGPVPTSASGTAVFPLPVPADPLLAGTLVGLQAAVIDAGNPSGFTVSNGLGALVN